MHEPPEAPPLPALRLLALEDDKGYAALLSELIREAEPEAQLQVIGSLADGIETLRRDGADCVLLDLSLPDASGLEGVGALTNAFPALAIVVLTANEQQSTALAAVAQGAEDYLSKRDADGPAIMRAIRYARGRKSVEAELRRTTAQLAAAEELARLGSWEWDLASHSVWPSRELCRIYGFDPDAFDGDFETLHSRVHPEDRPSLERAIDHAMGGRDGRFEAQYRITRPDGGTRLIRAVGEVRREDRGRPTSILGIGLDVTDQEQAAEEMALTRERLARESAVAETLQRSLLPHRLPAISGCELGALYEPAAGGRIGGDFYDVFPIHEAWYLVIGDVAGKGPDAAALSALARYTLRADAQRERDPARLLELLNGALVREGYRYVTAACAALAPREGERILTVASGGHPPPLLVRQGIARPLAGTGILLGYEPGATYRQVSEPVEPGDTVVLYTDGVTDAQAPEVLDTSDVAGLVAPLGDLPPAEVARRLESAVLRDGNSRRDDIAILVLRIT